MDGLDKGCYSVLRTRPQNRPGKPSSDVASDILIRQVPARLSERQGSTSETFKPQQDQLPLESITNKFATGPTGLLAEPVKKLFQVGVQSDGDSGSHVVTKYNAFPPHGHVLSTYAPGWKAMAVVRIRSDNCGPERGVWRPGRRRARTPPG